MSRTGHILVLALIIGAVSLMSLRMSEHGRKSNEPTHDSVQPVNAIVGDAGYMAAFGRMPDTGTAEDVRIATHLAYVEQILRARPVDHLSDEQARHRSAALDHLHTYWKEGEFPRNTTRAGQRTPVFIDRDGRICAVGYLIQQTAGRGTAEAINERFQFARILEIDAPVVSQWAEHYGFTLRELAMIQPAYCWRPPSPDWCVEDDDRTKAIGVVALGLNASSVLLNGWMAARSDRNLYVAGGGLLVGGAGIAVGISDGADYRAATLAAAGASILLSGWNLLRTPRDDHEQTGDRVATATAVTPTWMAGSGSNRPGLRLVWAF